MDNNEKRYQRYLEAQKDAPKLEAERLTRIWQTQQHNFPGITLKNILLCHALKVIRDDANLAVTITSPESDAQTKDLAVAALQKHIEWEANEVGETYKGIQSDLDELSQALSANEDIQPFVNSLGDAVHDILNYDETFEGIVRAYNKITFGGSRD